MKLLICVLASIIIGNQAGRLTWPLSPSLLLRILEQPSIDSHPSQYAGGANTIRIIKHNTHQPQERTRTVKIISEPIAHVRTPKTLQIILQRPTHSLPNQQPKIRTVKVISQHNPTQITSRQHSARTVQIISQPEIRPSARTKSIQVISGGDKFISYRNRGSDSDEIYQIIAASESE